MQVEQSFEQNGALDARRKQPPTFGPVVEGGAIDDAQRCCGQVSVERSRDG